MERLLKKQNNDVLCILAKRCNAEIAMLSGGGKYRNTCNRAFQRIINIPKTLFSRKRSRYASAKTSKTIFLYYFGQGKPIKTGCSERTGEGSIYLSKGEMSRSDREGIINPKRRCVW